MASCTDFLRDYSDYRDGYLDPAGSASMEAHLSGCAGCARYARVLEEGVEQLRSLPGIEPSSDFHARLQHRIYHLEEERAGFMRRDGAGTSALFVGMLVVLMALATWWPQRRPALAVVELPPVAAEAPRKSADLHALFRSGPLLTPTHEAGRVVSPAANTVFFRYTRLGSHGGFNPGYAIDTARPR